MVFKWSYDFRSRTSVIWKLFLGPPCFYQKFSLMCSQVLLSSWRTSPGASVIQLLRLHGPLDSMDLRLHSGTCILIQKHLISWCLVLVYKATAPQKKTQWPKSSWNISSWHQRRQKEKITPEHMEDGGRDRRGSLQITTFHFMMGSRLVLSPFSMIMSWQWCGGQWGWTQ